MKKIMKVFVLVAAAAMALASCQKPEVDNSAPQEYEYTFLIGGADDAESKAVIGNENVEWKEGDRMGVYTKVADGTISNNADGDITPGTPATMKMSSNQALETGDYIYAYYPYDESNKNGNLTVTLNIPTIQDGKDDMPMVAIPHCVESAISSGQQNAPVGKIKFANLGSVIEFHVYSTTVAYQTEVVKSVTFNAEQAIAGDFTFDMTAVDYSNEKTLAIPGCKANSVVSTLSTSTQVSDDKDAATVVKMVVAPGSYTGNIVVTTDKATYTYPISTAKEFKRSAVQPLGVNLRENVRQENTSSEPVEVTATLTFDANKANRTEYSTSKQVWEQNGIKLTNDKASSNTNVGDYSNPARFYKSSTIKIEAPGNILKLEFNCSNIESKYVEPISAFDGASTKDGIITINLDGTSNAVAYLLSEGQGRVNSLTVTYVGGDYVPLVLESISISGYKTKFVQDETFSFGGVVTATYDDGSTRDVTKLATVSEPNMSEVGTQRVTVTYEGKIATYDITIEEKPADAKAWTLVTDVSTLNAGDQVVIVAKESNYAMSTTQNSNNRAQASVVKNGNIITFGSDVQILTLKAGKTSGTYAFYTGSGYLYAASSSKNYLKTETTLSANSSWNITIANGGVATIKATGSNTRNWMRYNSSNNPPIFSCYGSGQTDVCIYKLQ